MPQLTAFFKDEIKRQILFLTLAAVSLLLSFFELNLPGVDSAWVAIILCGVPIVIGATIAVFGKKARHCFGGVVGAQHE